MSKLSKILVAVAAITGVAVVGILLLRPPVNGPESDAQASFSEPTPPDSAETNSSSFFTKRGRRQPAQASAGGQSLGVSDTATNLITAWEEKVDDILGSTNSEPDKARQMLELFPQLPAEGQVAVAQHLSNLVPDQDYRLLHASLTNTALPEEVLDVLLDDTLNRPNSLKLPALLEVARNPQNPKAAEAKDFLELFLEEDYGNDWDKWQASMDQWLKDNPD
jgi:hypothetical protein